MLVLPFKPKEKTKGGINISRESLEKQQVASTVWFSFKNGTRLLWR